MTRPWREQQAWDEIGHTEVGRPVAAVLAGLALLSLLAVGALQSLWPDPRQVESPFARFAWAALAALASFDGSLQVNRDLLAEKAAFESALEDASWLQRAAQPAVQQVVTVWGGAGNEQVYVGRDGWLFFRPDVDQLTGPGYLTPRVIERRRRGAASWRALPEPDPLPALLDFHRQLAARGIALVVLPVPTKTVLVPRALAPAAPDPAEKRLENPSDAELRRRLEDAGAMFYDAVPALLAARRATGREPFLRTDTHWTPQAMDAVARDLASLLERAGLVTSPRRDALVRTSAPLRRFGDLSWMLKLPSWQRWLEPDEVTLAPVHDTEGRPWRSDPAAEVLLLGDSFANIYSLAKMRWGESAGFAEQLSFHLGRPVELLAENDGGDFAVRQQLARDLAAGRDRLAGKRVVVYQFAARRLSTGDWRRVELPAPSAQPGEALVPFVARARVAALSRLPAPGTTPYRDGLIAVHLVEVENLDGGAAPRELLAYAWGLRDGRPAGAASWRSGQRLEVRLIPWSQAPPELGSLQRFELLGDELLFLDTFWVETDDANPH